MSCIVCFWGSVRGGEALNDEHQMSVLQHEQAGLPLVRPFEVSDHDAVLALAEENAYWLNGSSCIAEILQSQQGRVYVCTIDEAIAGFIIFDIVAHDKVMGNIRYMAVKHRFRHSGCGRLLLMRAMQILHDEFVDMICLSVRSDNERAIRFYQSMGFGFVVMHEQQPNWACMCWLGKSASEFVALNHMLSALLPVAL